MEHHLPQLQQQCSELVAQLQATGSIVVMNSWSEYDKAQVAALYFSEQFSKGGFIQFFHNGYAFLLLPIISWLQKEELQQAAQLLDAALKYYVENREAIDAPEDAKSFAQLYGQHPYLVHAEEAFLPHVPVLLKTLIKP